MTYYVIDTATGQRVNDFGNGSRLSLSDLGRFTVEYVPDAGAVARVDFFINGSLADTATGEPFIYAPPGASPDESLFPSGAVTLEVVLYSADGSVLGTDVVTFETTGELASQEGGEGADLTAADRSEFEVEAEAEAEAETEIEAEASADTVSGALATGAIAAAYGSNALTQTMVSGSIDLALRNGVDPTITAPLATEGPSGDGVRAIGGDGTLDGSGDAEPDVIARVGIVSSEAEAEVEVESEVEVEVGFGSAVAVGATSIANAAVGTVIYFDENGEAVARALTTAAAADAATSTSVTVGGWSEDLPPPTVNDGSDAGAPAPTGDTATLSNGPTVTELTGANADLLTQADSETEVEVESEAEAEAEVAAGAAGAAVSGGSGVAIAGEFGAADAETAVRTSTSAGEVTSLEPTIFENTSASGFTQSTLRDLPTLGSAVIYTNGAATAAGTPGTITEIVTAPSDSGDAIPTGYAETEAEAEAEAEAEVEAEVGNNAAAVAVIATGGGGATGIGATSIVSTSASASTSTLGGGAGEIVGRNDVVESSEERSANDPATIEDRVFERRDAEGNLLVPPAEAEAEVEAEAEAEASGAVPTHSAVVTGDGLGDAVSGSALALSGMMTTQTGVVSDGTHAVADRPAATPDTTNDYEVLTTGSVEVIPLVESVETELEAEAEAEAEAEVGFNAAAAGAAAVGVMAGNNVYGIPTEAATATSTATKVGDGVASTDSYVDLPGPTELGAYGDIGGIPVSLGDLIFEIETEAEAEAEVGIGAGAAAAAAGAGGKIGIDADSQSIATINGAAAAAAAGAYTQIFIEIPDPGEAGTIRAYAKAWDPDGGGVSAAVAVAGLSIFAGLDNEAELEAEGLYEVEVEVVIQTGALTEASYAFLLDFDAVGNLVGGVGDIDDELEGPDSRVESESEVESEAEAEAGYGVAAAAAATAAASVFSDVSATTSVATTDVGSIFGDSFDGTAEDDFISGTDRIDVIRGGLGQDFLRGGAGGDRIDGGEGADFISGGAGGDYLNGGLGRDYLVGGRGNDVVDGSGGLDTAFIGNDQNKEIFRDAQGVVYVVDTVSGEADLYINVERFETNNGYVEVDEITQFDALTYIASNIDRFDSYDLSRLDTSALINLGAYEFATSGLADGADRDGFSAMNYLAANPDLVDQFDGDQVGATLNYILQGASLGRLPGDPGSQTLPGLNVAPITVGDQYATVSELTVRAENGVLSNDYDPNGDPLVAILQSGTQNGSVRLNSDGSFDYLANAGFVGEDSFTYRVFDGQELSDIVTVTLDVGNAAAFAPGNGPDILIGSGGDDRLSGLGGRDELRGGAGADLLDGGDGNDLLIGGEGSDELRGGAGDDTLDGARDELAFTGGDILNGGSGNDRYIVNGSATLLDSDQVTEVATETSAAGLATDTDTVIVQGSYFSDVFGVAERIEIAADAARDAEGFTWVVSGLNDSEIIGSAGRDLIFASGGQTTISGNGGDDTIVFNRQVSAPDDSATTLVVSGTAGDTLLRLFDVTADRVDLSSFAFTAFSDFSDRLETDAGTGDAVLNLAGPGVTLTFEGLTTSEITESIFVF